MEITKRYYWIKLKTDFFNLAEIDFLLSQQDGCKYIVLYQMLCLQTANNNGELASRLGEMIIPYDADKIVRDTKYFSRDTVIVAMELFKKLNLIYTDKENCLKIAGFENMVGSETGWAKQKREQREKQKLLSGQCPPNSPIEIDIDKESDTEIDKDIGDNRLKERLNIINSKIKKENLVQEETSNYNAIFNQKKIYIQNIDYLPENLLNQIKLYQLAVKRLCDSNQLELLDKVTLPILEKVFGKILKCEKIENIKEYYISSLVNEISK